MPSVSLRLVGQPVLEPGEDALVFAVHGASDAGEHHLGEQERIARPQPLGCIGQKPQLREG